MKDYKELVEALRCKELEKIACPDCAERECVANSGRGLWCRVPKLMDDAADAIEELLQIADHYEQTAKDYWQEACDYKAQIPHWISVEERLPDDSFQRVIATGGKEMCLAFCYGRIGDVVYWKKAKNKIDVCGGFLRGITHWMPLPEPPMGVQE